MRLERRRPKSKFFLHCCDWSRDSTLERVSISTMGIPKNSYLPTPRYQFFTPPTHHRPTNGATGTVKTCFETPNGSSLPCTYRNCWDAATRSLYRRSHPLPNLVKFIFVGAPVELQCMRIKSTLVNDKQDCVPTPSAAVTVVVVVYWLVFRVSVVPGLSSFPRLGNAR